MVGGAGHPRLWVWADFAFCAFHGLLIMFCVPGLLEMENGEKSIWTICVRSGRTSCGAVGHTFAFGALQKLILNIRV